MKIVTCFAFLIYTSTSFALPEWIEEKFDAFFKKEKDELRGCKKTYIKKIVCPEGEYVFSTEVETDRLSDKELRGLPKVKRGKRGILGPSRTPEDAIWDREFSKSNRLFKENKSPEEQDPVSTQEK